MSQAPDTAAGRRARTRASALWLVVLVAASLGADAGERPKATVPTATSTRPVVAAPRMSFEEIREQPAGAIGFVSRGPGYVLALSSHEALLALRSQSSTGAAPAGVLRLRMTGAARRQPEGIEALPGQVYRTVDDGPSLTARRTFRRVKYSDVYPGVDVIFHAEEGQLEFDFLVHPHADPAQIRLALHGADSIVLTGNGDLSLAVGREEIRLKKPRVYQDIGGARHEIAGGFMLGKNSSVAFTLAEYDASHPLIVDPVVVFASYLGSQAEDHLVSVQADAAGNVYAFGRTQDADTFPATTSVGTNIVTLPKCFLSRLDAAGANLGYSVVFADSFVVSNVAACDAMQVTPDGRVAVLYTGDDGFTKTVRVLAEQDGSLVSLAAFRAIHLEGLLPAFGIVLDSNNDVYVVGACFNARSQIPPPIFLGGFRTEPSVPGRCDSPNDGFTVGPSESVLARYDISGATRYATYVGGSDDDERAALALAIDGTGFGYIAGQTRSLDLPVRSKAYQPACSLMNGVCADAFLMKVDTSQAGVIPNEDSLVYSTYLGGTSIDAARAVHVDASGRVSIAGLTESHDFPSAPDSADWGFTDSGTFVARFDLGQPGSAQLDHTTLFPYGQPGAPSGQFAFFSDGSFAISGDVVVTADSTFPLVDPLPVQPDLDTGWTFASVFAPDGRSLRFSSFIASGARPRVAPLGTNGLVIGLEAVTGGLATPGAYQEAPAGHVDLLLMKVTGIASSEPNRPPVLSTNSPVIVPATSESGALAVMFANATDADGDAITYTWQFGAATAVGQAAAFQFPIGTSTATVTADDGHGNQVSVQVTVIVRGAVVPGSGDATVSVPATYDGGLKSPGSLPDVRLEFHGLSAPGIVALNVRTDMLPPPPAGHQFGSPPYIYDLAATAAAETMTVCIDTAGMTFADAANARLYRIEGTTWNALSPPLAGGSSLCAATPTLGSFAIFTPAVSGSAAVTLAGTGGSPDVVFNPDGSTIVPDGGLATDTPLLNADGAAIDRARNVLYFSDFNRIRRVDLTSGLITTIAGSGAYPEMTSEPGTGALRLVNPDDQRIGAPARLALDAGGRLYIAEMGRCRVLRFDPDTNALTRFVGDGYCRSAGDGLPADQASVISPFGLAFDTSGNLFVADPASRLVRRVDALTGLISTVVGGGVAVAGSGQPALNSYITPVDIAVGRNGDLYIVQDDPFLLRVETGGDGLVNGLAGETVHVLNTCALSSCPALPFGGDGHPVASAIFHRLNSIAAEPSGALLVSEHERNRIRRIAAGADGVADGVVRTAAGFDATFGDPPVGWSLFLNGEDFALSSGISFPVAIAVDPAGGFAWADHHRPMIRHTGQGASSGPQADLSVVATASPEPVNAGSTLTYTVTVTNHGPDTAHGVRVSLAVPDTVTLVASTPAGACNEPPAAPAGSINCGLGDLAAGLNTSIQIETRPTAAGFLAVTLAVSSDETDANTTNNVAAVSTSVALAPVVIEVTEPITVTDAPTVLKSVMVDVVEPITVTDTPTVMKSVMVDVVEPITVTDAPTVLKSVVVAVIETIAVTDTPTLASPALGVSPASGFPGGTTTLSATLTSLGTPVPGKAIAFTLFGTAVGTATTGADGVASLTGVSLPAVAAGIYPGAVQASFPGDATLQAATGSADLTVSLPPTTVVLTSSLNPSVGGDSVTFTAILSSIGGTPQGSVELSYRVPGRVLPIVLGTLALDPSGRATLTTTDLFVGNLGVTAHYPGTAVFAASSGFIQQTVTPALTTTALVSSHTNSFTTQPPVFTATVQTPAHWPPAGTVEFFADGVSLGRAPVFDRGGQRVAVMGGATLGVGTHSMTARYIGDASSLGSESGPLSQHVIQGGYATVDLTPQSTDHSVATAVNAVNQVVGVFFSLANQLVVPPYGFLYSGGGLAPVGGPGTRTIPLAINDSGQVVGQSSAGGMGDHAFLYQGGQMIDLGTLGGATSQALAINNAGQVVGTSDTGSGSHAFLYENGTLRDLATLGGSDSAALAINAAGFAAGHADLADGTRHAAYYTSPWLDLGTLGGTTSRAAAINDAGQVAGTSDLAGDADAHAFVWHGGGLTDIAGATGPSSHAIAINDAGQVVGWTFLPAEWTNRALPPPVRQAFFYARSQFSELGTVAGGTSQAADISNAGLLVGESDGRAFVSAGGALRDLGTLGGPTSVAIAVNDRGLIVGAADTASGVRHAAAWLPVPVPTLVVDPATGPAGGTTTLVARLTLFGLPASNQSLTFTLNGSAVGAATTDDSGAATLSGVSLAGIGVGTHAGVVHVAYAGSVVLGAAHATGDLTVTPPIDHPPVAVDDAFSIATGPSSVAAPGVLANDADEDGDALTAVLVSGATRGTVTLAADGSFTYTPHAGAPVSDTFTYRAIGAGVASNAATVSLTAGPIQPVFAGVVAVPFVPIAVGPGDQNDPHVDGDVVSYTNNPSGTFISVDYYDFRTGVNAVVPRAASEGDYLSAVSGQRIAFSRLRVDGSVAAMLFDINTSQLTEIDPQPSVTRFSTEMGGNTLAFLEFQGLNPDVFAWDLAGATGVNVSASPDSDVNIGVSPDGSVLVWQRLGTSSGSDILMARKTGGAWTTSTVANTPSPEENPDTDGEWIVYDADRPESPTGPDIYLRPVGGGPETRLAMAGRQFVPSVHRGVISFGSRATANAAQSDIFVYVLATNALYQVTDTPTVEEIYSDVSVLPNGDIRVVWQANDDPIASLHNVRAVTFTPAPPGQPVRRTLTVTLAGNGTGTVTSAPDGGIQCGATCTAVFDALTTVSLVPTAAPGSVFGGWSGDPDCADGVITMRADVACTAAFNRWPNLEVAALGLPASAPSGAAIVVTDTTANSRAQGGPAFPGISITRFYLSSDRTVDGGDTILGERAVPSLGPSQVHQGTTTLTLPAGVVGDLFVIAAADADGAVPEANEGDNARAERLRVGADLNVMSLTVEPRRARAGDVVQVTIRTRNALNAAEASRSATRLYLSRDETLDAADLRVGQRDVGGLAPGAIDEATISVTLPPGLAPGDWFFIARADADAQVVERNESDNERTRPLVVRP